MNKTRGVDLRIYLCRRTRAVLLGIARASFMWWHPRRDVDTGTGNVSGARRLIMRSLFFVPSGIEVEFDDRGRQRGRLIDLGHEGRRLFNASYDQRLGGRAEPRLLLIH